ncbi:hypothetical protein C789_5193 [Microcystis aeruginosa FACHB-905 = DIANCHI905]|nr:hypothetical protein C789_5193 [Microcystis aeruginosa FACHB-905 = DIANCHI905]
MSDAPLIKGGLRGDPPAYRHPPYQGGQGGIRGKIYLLFN